MADAEGRIQAALDAALRGEPVDWDGLSASLRTPEDLATLRNVRAIADMAGAQRRQFPQPASEPPTEPAPSGPDQTPEPAFAADEGPPAATCSHWGRLEVRSRLGSGGYGTVYLARDPKLRRDVALKLYQRPEPLPGESFQTALDAFLSEARLAAQVKHPNVVTVYDMDEHDGIPGIWMEYVPGKTLQELITESGPLGWRDACRVLRALCDALDAVHRNNIVHRDITAKNVMVEESGRIVLMDFGIGRSLETTVRSTRHVQGTLRYMAPETVVKGTYSRSSDIYSVGVLSHFLVTGDFPETFGKSRALADKDVPPAVAAIIRRCLSSDPGQRPQSPAEIRGALDGIIAAEGRGKPRLRQAAMIGAAVVLIAAVAITMVKRPWESHAREPGVAGVAEAAAPAVQSVETSTPATEGPSPTTPATVPRTSVVKEEETSAPTQTKAPPGDAGDEPRTNPVVAPSLRAEVSVDPGEGGLETRFRFRGRVAPPAGATKQAPRFRWDWNGDAQWDTEPSTVDSIVHVFTQPGTYQVMLKAIAGDGTEGMAACSVVVRARPVARFTYAPQHVTTADTVVFDASGSRDPVSPQARLTYYWGWGHQRTYETSLAVPSVSHRFAVPAPKEIPVYLIVANEFGLRDTTSQVIRIEPYLPSGELVRQRLDQLAQGLRSKKIEAVEEAYCGTMPAADRARLNTLFTEALRISAVTVLPSTRVDEASGSATAEVDVDFIRNTTLRDGCRLTVRLGNRCEEPGWWLGQITTADRK